MKKSIEIIQFLVLLLVLSVSAIIFQQTFENLYRFLIIVCVAIFYVFWGYWHHSHLDRLDKTVILEYSLVAAIVVVLAALGLGIIRFF